MKVRDLCGEKKSSQARALSAQNASIAHLGFLLPHPTTGLKILNPMNVSWHRPEESSSKVCFSREEENSGIE